MTQDCAHEHIWFDTRIELMEQSDGTRWMGVRLRLKCSACDVLFSWRGLNSGGANPDEPVISADGYELRAPVQARPGGVVGLLAAAGMTDQLVSPERLSREPEA